jgi:hypothetical protein
MGRTSAAAIMGLCVIGLASSPARAQVDLFSSETLHGIADIGLVVGGGEESWLDTGFGKTVGGDGAELSIPRAAIVWTPTFGMAFRGHVTVQYQAEADEHIDINEAYVTYRAPPLSFGRISARVGLFYPPVSLEHTGTAWSTPDTLSASAINSWIGEEVVVGGVEASLRRNFGAHEIIATGAVFGWNDTSGTLLSFRGWALHGAMTGAGAKWRLPPLTAFIRPRQYAYTTPVLELDNRAGYYGRLEWRPPAPIAISAIYYDNAGDRIAVDSNREWAWETRFVNLGLKWQASERTTVMAQAMNGETLMGFRRNGSIWVDVGFQSAYVLAQRTYGEHTGSLRFDVFETSDRTLVALDNNNEHGWAATAAWRQNLTKHADILFEVQHVSSDRPARVLTGVAPGQDQTVFQTALRLSF